MDIYHRGRLRPERDQAPLWVLVLAASLLVLLGYFAQADSMVAQATTTVVVTSDTTLGVVATAGTTTTTVLVHPVRNPTRIVIPSIDVDVPVVPVGLLQSGDIETPQADHAGWYSLGPAPGDPGPAVILAHADTAWRPDVFHHLKYLRPGDEIWIYGTEEAPAVFVVDSVEEQLKVGLPRERIWDYSSQSLIRLITCGGKFDFKTRHYLSNVIVYGHLVR